jgi:glycosyltransferase involved in cell wall biosynthesis
MQNKIAIPAIDIKKSALPHIDKICHLSSAHHRNDVRIFLKECSSLAHVGYIVNLIIADGKGDEEKNGVTIIDAGRKTGSRLFRMTVLVYRIFKRAVGLNASLYHIHDPELLPAGLILKLKGKKVIYDAHEDLPRQILTKEYIPLYLRKIISFVIELFENFAAGRFDSIITATPFIRDRFKKYNKYTYDINNFPLPGELVSKISWKNKKNEVCYIGGISKLRGVREVVYALAFTAASFCLCGEFSPAQLIDELEKNPGWKKVKYLGFVSRKEAYNVMSRSIAGIVTFLAAPNHVNAQPNKMFEYMSAGIPVICSHFPLWRDIIEKNECGICVDPSDPEAIAAAINYLKDNPVIARKMGENGRRAVIEKYNWNAEENKIKEIYSSLLG